MKNEKWALEKAVQASLNSNCKSKRGVVIWSREIGLVGVGWNAPPKPLLCDGSDVCRANCAKTAVHAEQAALLDMLKDPHLYMDTKLNELEMIHVKSVNGEAVVSEKPSCWQCSKLILASGIKSMWLYQKEGFVEYSAQDFHEQTLINCELK